MESRIKKKAAIYALAAILITAILATAILNFGTEIQIFPPAAPPKPATTSAFLSRFTSAEQLKNFLGNNSGTQGPFMLYGTWDVTMVGLGRFAKATLDASSGIPTYEGSTTNVQVEGVDETDTVKSDSSGHVYVLSGNVVTILKAYPPENAAVLSRIVFDDLYPRGIFVNGDRLAVLGVEYSP
jgi:inhibitor of cysteine peptidase